MMEQPVPTLRQIADELSVIAGHSVVEGAKDVDDTRCEVCTVWMHVSHLASSLTNKLREVQVANQNARINQRPVIYRPN